MIHSLAGGKLRDNQIFDVVKVKFINNPLALDRPYWFKSNLVDLKEGDVVFAPFSNDETLYEAKVIRIDKNINEQNTPFPASKMKFLISKNNIS